LLFALSGFGLTQSSTIVPPGVAKNPSDDSTIPPGLTDLPSRQFASIKQQEPFRSGGRGGRQGSRFSDRNDYANWKIPVQWHQDVFTFVRVKFDSYGYARPGRMWDNDYPDCDWNFSTRLHELTSIRVDPNGKVLKLSDPEIFDHPFLFMSNANQIALSPDEAKAFRRYLLNGGFVMIDDFWAPRAFEHIVEEMKQVFPDRQPRELPSNHPIFSLVYRLKGVPQVPSVHAWRQGDLFEYWHGDPEGDEAPHFWGYFDDDQRLVALLCHNNDIGDGWEREGENEEYFHQYSERVSYPLGINIIVYALTH
jgi:hypothetical protein